jgi:hypothetical protein
LACCPRSSLPAKVLAWLAARLAHPLPPRPPGQGGNPPLSLEVRLDAVAAVILDGLSYRRAARMVGISKTEVGDSLDLLLPKLAALGFCQPDGTFITTLQELRELLEEMAQAGEAVVVDGLATRVQRPCGWANQKGCCARSCRRCVRRSRAGWRAITVAGGRTAVARRLPGRGGRALEWGGRPGGRPVLPAAGAAVHDPRG